MTGYDDQDEDVNDVVVEHGQDQGGDDDIEQRARAQGWRPEEEWDEERAKREGRKKPTKFYTAKEFLDRVAGNIPMLNERLRRLEAENRKLETNQKEFSSLIEDQRKAHREALERVRANTRKEVEEELQKAAVEGDMDAHKAAVAKMKTLEEEDRKAAVEAAKAEAKPAAEDPAASVHDGPHPDMVAWVDRNKAWFSDKSRVFLNAYMVAAHSKVVAGNPDLSVTEALDRAKRQVMTRFPEEFGGAAPRRAGSPGVDGNALGNSRGGTGQTVEERFNALPRDARDAYERARVRMASLKPPAKFTKEQYLVEYGE